MTTIADSITLIQAKRMYLALLVYTQKIAPLLKEVIDTPLRVNAQQLLNCVAMKVYFNSGYTACETYGDLDEFKYALIEDLADEFYCAEVKNKVTNLYDFANLPDFELYPFKKQGETFMFIGSRFLDLTSVAANFSKYPTNVRLSAVDNNLPDFDQEVLVKKYLSMSLSILTDLKTLVRAVSPQAVHRSLSAFKENLEYENPSFCALVESLAHSVIPSFEQAIKAISADFSAVKLEDLRPEWVSTYA